MNDYDILVIPPKNYELALLLNVWQEFEFVIFCILSSTIADNEGEWHQIHHNHSGRFGYKKNDTNVEWR